MIERILERSPESAAAIQSALQTFTGNHLIPVLQQVDDGTYPDLGRVLRQADATGTAAYCRNVAMPGQQAGHLDHVVPGNPELRCHLGNGCRRSQIGRASCRERGLQYV